MNCGGFKTNFSAYLDGELHGALAVEAESHLDNCPRCAGMLKAYRIGVDFLSHSPVKIEPPDDMFERVMTAAVEGGAKEAGVTPLRTAAGRNTLAAAAVVMIALVGSLLFTGGDRTGVAWNPAVDSTVDVVNAGQLPAAGGPEEKTVKKRPAQKAYLAAYRPDDGEPALSYGVSSHPVLVESGVFAAE